MTGVGAWAEPTMLTGYEFRMAVKLFKITRRLLDGEKLSSAARKSWIDRYCVDMTSQQIHYPENYYRVAPYDRLFIWSKDVVEGLAGSGAHMASGGVGGQKAGRVGSRRFICEARGRRLRLWFRNEPPKGRTDFVLLQECR